MNYPETPGFKKRGTSKAAADSMKEIAPTLESEALVNLAVHGDHTADELAFIMGRSILSIRPRLSALLAKGLIVDTGETRRTQSGRYATVWRAV